MAWSGMSYQGILANKMVSYQPEALARDASDRETSLAHASGWCIQLLALRYRAIETCRNHLLNASISTAAITR